MPSGAASCSQAATATATTPVPCPGRKPQLKGPVHAQPLREDRPPRQGKDSLAPGIARYRCEPPPQGAWNQHCSVPLSFRTEPRSKPLRAGPYCLIDRHALSQRGNGRHVGIGQLDRAQWIFCARRRHSSSRPATVSPGRPFSGPRSSTRLPPTCTQASDGPCRPPRTLRSPWSSAAPARHSPSKSAAPCPPSPGSMGALAAAPSSLTRPSP